MFADDAVREAARHLLEGCSSCRALLDPRSAAILAREPERALAAILRAHRREKALHLEASLRFAKLGAESVETAPRRMRGFAGVLTLLYLSRFARVHAKSLQIPYALFARLLADQLDPREHGERQVADLRCDAALLLAQGYCFGQQFERADQAIGWAATAFVRGFQRPQLKALLLDTWAMIHFVQGRHEKAWRSICAAMAIHEELGDRDSQAITLARMSLQRSFAGQTEEAIKLMREARLSLDEERFPAIYFSTIHRQAKLLVALGRFREARILLWTNLGRYSAYGGELDQAERTSLEGVINDGLGNLDAAVRDLSEAAVRFLDLNDSYAVALTSLDLAAVLMDKKQPEDALECADVAIRTFQLLEISEEAHAALLVLKETFDRQLADSDLLRRTARYMRELHPEARFLPER